MKSEIHKLYITFEDRINVQDSIFKDRLIVSIVSILGLLLKQVIGYNLYFNTEQDMILFKLKYNI